MDVLLALAYLLLALATAIFLIRLFIGPSVADRVIALDGILVTILGGVLVEASRSDTALPIAVVLVVALLGFVGTGVLARYIEQRGT